MRSEQVKKNERIEKDEIYNGEQSCAIQCNTQFQGICSVSVTKILHTLLTEAQLQHTTYMTELSFVAFKEKELS